MKRLISLMLAVLLVASVSFAGDYDQPGLTGGQHLYQYGIVQGDNGNLNEHKSFNREQLATLIARLYGLDAEAEHYKGASGYKDESKFTWAKGYISYAKMKGWMEGSNGVFNNLGEVTGEELATVLLRILNREEKWGTNIGRMGALGVIVPSGKLSRGQTFDAIWGAFSNPIMADGSTLGVNLNKLQPIDKTPTTLEVVSITTPGLTRVAVEFNQAPKKIDSTKVSIAGMTVSDVYGNGKSLVFRVSPALTNQKEYTVKLENVASDSGKAPNITVEKKFTALDSTMPEVEEFAFSGPKHLTFRFNEEIASAGKVEIKQGNVTVTMNNSKTVVSGRNVTAEAYTNFVEGKEYTITVSDFKDIAGYANKIYKANLVYQKDTTPPTIKGIAGDSEEVRLYFSKPVKGASIYNFAHSFASYHPLRILVAKGTYDPNQLYNYLALDFYDGNPSDKPLPNGSVKVMVTGKSSGGTITDAWGNPLENVDLTVNVQGDSSPLVATVTPLNATDIQIAFNKHIKLPVVSDFAIKKTDGSHVPFTLVTESQKKFILRLGTPVTSQTLHVEIVKAVDLSPFASELKNHKVSVTFGDTEAPQIDTIVAENIYENGVEIARDLIITFVKDDVSNDAVNGKFYKLTNGSNFYGLDGLVGEFVGGNRTVRFRLPKSSINPAMYAIAAFSPGNKVLVGDIKDNSGNVMISTTYTVYDTFTLDLHVDDAETFDTYKGAKREGIKLTMTANVAGVNTYSGITFDVPNLKVNDAEIDGRFIYLFTTGARIPSEGGFRMAIPGGTFVSDLGRDSIGYTGIPNDRINPRAKTVSEDNETELDLYCYSPDVVTLKFTEDLMNTPNIDDYFNLIIKVSVERPDGTIVVLTPIVDFTCAHDTSNPTDVDITMTSTWNSNDTFIVECGENPNIKDLAGNSMKARVGAKGKIMNN